MDPISLLMDILSINHQNSQPGSGSGINASPVGDESSLSLLAQYLITNQDRMARLETEINYLSGSKERLVKLEGDISHLEKALEDEKRNVEKRFNDSKESKRFIITVILSIIALIISFLSVYVTYNVSKSVTLITTEQSQSMPDTKR